MSTSSVTLRGYGNGTFNGTIALVVTRGYGIGAASVPDVPGVEWSLDVDRPHWSIPSEYRPHWQNESDRPHWQTTEG